MAASKVRRQRRSGKAVEAMLSASCEMQLMLMDQVSLVYDPANPPKNLASETGKFQKIFTPANCTDDLFMSIFSSPFSEVKFQVTTCQHPKVISTKDYSTRVLVYDKKHSEWLSCSICDSISWKYLDSALDKHKLLCQSFFSMDFPEFAEYCETRNLLFIAMLKELLV